MMVGVWPGAVLPKAEHLTNTTAERAEANGLTLGVNGLLEYEYSAS